MQPDLSKYRQEPKAAPLNNENQHNEQRENCDTQSCGKLRLLSGNEYNCRAVSNMKSSSQKAQTDVSTWIKTEGPKRVNIFLKKIGIDKALIQPERRSELLQLIDKMGPLQLYMQRKCVKLSLSSYDNDFKQQFDYYPKHDQKMPMKQLYYYYRSIKQCMEKKEKQQEIEKLSKKFPTNRQKIKIQVQMKVKIECMKEKMKVLKRYKQQKQQRELKIHEKQNCKTIALMKGIFSKIIDIPSDISVIPTEVMQKFMSMLGNFVRTLRMGNGRIVVKGQKRMRVHVKKNEDAAQKLLRVLAILMKKQKQRICLKE